MEDFSLLYLIMENHTESREDAQPLSSSLTKETRGGKKCKVFGCFNIFYDSEVITAGIH